LGTEREPQRLRKPCRLIRRPIEHFKESIQGKESGGRGSIVIDPDSVFVLEGENDQHAVSCSRVCVRIAFRPAPRPGSESR